MDYPVPQYSVVAAPPAKMSGIKIALIVLGVVVGVILLLGAIGIALGVGLGVGLSRRNQDSSGNSATTTTYSILAAPTVSCTYGGSSTCGCAATKPSFLQARIYQGYTSVSNSWPWIVALYINNGAGFCGGFLVTYRHVITAAHCVYGVTPSTIVAIAGIQQLSTLSGGQARRVTSVTIAPGYDSSTTLNDLAILTLASAFTTTTTVGLCCIPSDASLPNVGDRGVIAGWGEIKGSTALSNDLQQGVIQVQSSSSCSVAITNNNRFCAGYDGTNACYGDSGSPFMISNNNSWTCAGLVSGTVSCGGNTVYTRVSAFYSLINSTINST